MANQGIGTNMRPEQGLSASVKGYEVHEDKACITHRKRSPNFYPLNCHLIKLALDAIFNRSLPFIHSVSPTPDLNKQISW
jgi:hypothetical protein